MNEMGSNSKLNQRYSVLEINTEEGSSGSSRVDQTLPIHCLINNKHEGNEQKTTLCVTLEFGRLGYDIFSTCRRHQSDRQKNTFFWGRGVDFLL